jgi:hypothetical protein
MTIHLKCDACGTDEKIVMHHISYKPESLVPLCKSCHRKVHRKYGKQYVKKNYVKYYPSDEQQQYYSKPILNLGEYAKILNSLCKQERRERSNQVIHMMKFYIEQKGIVLNMDNGKQSTLKEYKDKVK